MDGIEAGDEGCGGDVLGQTRFAVAGHVEVVLSGTEFISAGRGIARSSCLSDVMVSWFRGSAEENRMRTTRRRACHDNLGFRGAFSFQERVE